jgi:peptidoglycan/xylan/chitin deacetylase (PgdA/CDA1 family)
MNIKTTIGRLMLRTSAVLLLSAGTAATAIAIDWPDGVTAVVTLSFDLDAETVWWKDPENMTGDPGPLSQGAYGPRVALPKILDLLSKHQVHATFFVPAWVASTYPESIRDIVAGGHEIGAHGVRHVSPNLLEPSEEISRLRLSIKVLEEVAGHRPVGYRAPAWALSPSTLEMVAREGFLYSSNLMDSDLPYLHKDPAGLVELPVSWVLDDAAHFWFDEETWNKTIEPAFTVQALWREEFEAIHAEHGYFGLTMHPQFIGRPARIRMLDEFLQWLQQFDGVWITTCQKVAEHVKGIE